MASILLTPYALRDHDGYVARTRERGLASGIELRSIHRPRDPRRSVARADAILVGGGNTFRLLAELHRKKLLGPVRRRAAAGMPYAGISAGTNVACPTMRTRTT